MTKEEMFKLAEKIKDGSATEQERLEFFKAVNFVLKEMKSELSEIASK